MLSGFLTITVFSHGRANDSIIPRMTNWLIEASELDIAYVGLASPDPSAPNAPSASWTSPPAGPARVP